MKLLYFAPVEEGGLAQYAIQQSHALARQGLHVIVLGHPQMRASFDESDEAIEFIQLASGFESRRPSGWMRKLEKASSIIRDTRHQIGQIATIAAEKKVRHLVISYYFEYFAPIWAGKLRRLHTKGMRIGTVVHDPVRDFRIGPMNWHRWSISQAYSFVDVAYVHDDRALDTGRPERSVQTVKIPHGLYEVPDGSESGTRGRVRRELGIPDDAMVLLSFGHIRDGKNLDLLIQALASFQNIHLLVVGREQSSSQRPLNWYRHWAEQHGVSARCHWVNEFVSDANVHQYFLASDIAVMLYSAEFRSASGVLNNAAQFGLPVLCSSGGGPLQQLVSEYDLGSWVQPDQACEAIRGLQALLDRMPFQQRWDQYRADNDWDRNASIVARTLFDKGDHP